MGLKDCIVPRHKGIIDLAGRLDRYGYSDSQGPITGNAFVDGDRLNVLAYKVCE